MEKELNKGGGWGGANNVPVLNLPGKRQVVGGTATGRRV